MTLTHWGRDKVAAISQTTLSIAFSWTKIVEFRINFHWSFAPKVSIDNNPALLQIMAWRRPGDKPLSEPVMVSLLTHICVTRPQWVNALHWRHNGHDSVSKHQPHDCLLNRLFRRRSKKISKLRVTGLCAGNSPETSEFPAQMASNAENVSIWWRHHGQWNSSKNMFKISKTKAQGLYFKREQRFTAWLTCRQNIHEQHGGNEGVYFLVLYC